MLRETGPPPEKNAHPDRGTGSPRPATSTDPGMGARCSAYGLIAAGALAPTGAVTVAPPAPRPPPARPVAPLGVRDHTRR